MPPFVERNRRVTLAGLTLAAFLSSTTALFAQAPSLPLMAPPRVAARALPPTPEMSIEAFLSQQVLAPNMTLERFLMQLHLKFHQADADRDGEISAADAVIHAQVARAAMRAMMAMQIMRADFDGDGAVTEDELRVVLRYDRRTNEPANNAPGAQTVDAQARELMKADADHDGRITYTEAEAYFDPRPGDMQLIDKMSEIVHQFLKFAPEGKKVATLADVDAGAIAIFRAVDTNGDGTVSDAELKAFRAQVMPQPQAANAPRPAPPPAARDSIFARDVMGIPCPMPKPSDAAKVVLVGSYESEALSTVTIGSQDVAVGVGNITVEPGTEPIYLVVTSYRPTIWRLYGATERIERLVLTTTMTPPVKNLPPDKPVVGAVGVPAERITFLERTRCIAHFMTRPSREAKLAEAEVKIDAGREPSVVAGIYSLSDVTVPSGTVHGATHGKLLIISKGTVTINGSDANVIVESDSAAGDIDLERFYPGGVIEIDPRRVVANMPVERYDVLPVRAGLAQLVKAGKLEVKDGEFLIKQKIRFPAELAGIYAVKFRLLRGVPLPDGDPGDSQVISDETGERIKLDTMGR